MDAPAGTFTDEFSFVLTEHKPDLLKVLECERCKFFSAYWDGDWELGVAVALAPLTDEITRMGNYAEEIDVAMSGTMEA